MTRRHQIMGSHEGWWVVDECGKPVVPPGHLESHEAAQRLAAYLNRHYSVAWK
jgi:hypothetical protein